MASGSAPKHDFAPAWLKIPTNSRSHKPSCASSTCSEHNDDHLTRTTRQRVALSPSPSTCSTVPCATVERERQQPHEHKARRDSARQATYSLRHHSIDGEEYYHPSSQSSVAPTGAQASVAANPNAGRQFASQPILNRRPHSRQESRDSGGYSNYGGPYKGSNNYNFAGDTNRSHWNRQRSFERSTNSRQNSGGAGRASANLSSTKPGRNGNRDKEREINGLSSNKDATVKFDQDFPSLGQGIAGGSEGTLKVANGSVWDGARSSKVQLGGGNNADSNVKKLQLVQKSIRNGALDKRSASPTGGTGSGSGSPKLSSATSTVGKSASTAQTQVCGTIFRAKQGAITRVTSKENGPLGKGSWSISPPPPTVKALNTRLVTHPKTVGDKKSDFLRTLRDEGITRVTCNDEDESGLSNDATPASPESPSGDDCDCTTFQDGKCCNSLADHQDKDNLPDKGVKFASYVNGIDSDVAKGISVKDMKLSQSLEAEQRLLREMGWKGDDEDDEEVYAPLTEAEVQEFENLSKKRQVIRPKNGLHQIPLHNLHLTWSPQRVLMAFPKNLDLSLVNDADSSSSDTDSD